MKPRNIKIILLLIAFVLFNCAFAQDFQTINGVKVYFKTTGDMFHSSWVGGKINAKAVTPKNINIQSYISKLTIELSKYPSKVISTNLQKIYVVDSLNFYGSYVGGSYFTGLGEGILYINATMVEKGSLPLADAVHHELFSILYYNYKSLFPKTEWVALNNIEYWNNTWASINDPTIKAGYQVKYAEDGFICSYAVTSFDNDISCMAQTVMYPGPYMHIYYRKYARIQQKHELVKKFLKSIDSSFTFPDMMAVALN